MFSLATKTASFVPNDVLYIARYDSDVNLSTYTFNSVDFGDPFGRSLVVIGVAARDGDNESITSTTIAGISATNVTTSVADQAMSGIFSANTSATSGTVVVNTSGTIDSISIAVWALYGLDSTTAHASASSGGASVTSRSVNINTVADGVVIAISTCNNSDIRLFTWTNITEVFDGVITSSGNSTCSGASNITTVASTPLAITATVSNTANNLALSAASWG